MSMLAEQVDGVIGVDTHRDTLAAVAITSVGAVLAHTEATTNSRGYQRLLDFAGQHVPGSRCWALEGTGSYGAGLAAFLDAAGERVVEVRRPKRPNPARRPQDGRDRCRTRRPRGTGQRAPDPPASPG
jgi:transposase